MDFLIVLLNKKNLTEGVKTHGTSRNFPNIQGKSFEKSTHKKLYLSHFALSSSN